MTFANGGKVVAAAGPEAKPGKPSRIAINASDAAPWGHCPDCNTPMEYADDRDIEDGTLLNEWVECPECGYCEGIQK